MKRKEGRPVSACCNAKLRKTPDGEFTNWNCTACGEHTDADGAGYTYLVKDPAHTSAGTVTQRLNSLPDT